MMKRMKSMGKGGIPSDLMQKLQGNLPPKNKLIKKGNIMPVRIRLSRGGAKKRPFYRIVVADSRRARDGKFIDQVGTYNPMLPKDSPDRVKIDVEKAKEWMAKEHNHLIE